MAFFDTLGVMVCVVIITRKLFISWAFFYAEIQFCVRFMRCTMGVICTRVMLDRG
jgi:hypothetical protein